jgi:4-hydroxythreonine-4-phosphate dehydrogenase
MSDMLGITLGDIGGIGPEVVFKSLIRLRNNLHKPTVIFGCHTIFSDQYYRDFLNQLAVKKTTLVEDLNASGIYLYECPVNSESFIKNRPDAINGKRALTYIQTAVSYIKKGTIKGLVTAPICKESLKLAGAPMTGHTTLLQSLSESKEVSMAFYTSELKTLLATIHIPLNSVAQTLTEELITTSIRHAHLFCLKLGITHPKIAVAGINPHASESGMFGNEEKEVIMPAIEACRSQGIEADGPFSPDTVFTRALKKEWDIVVSMYHDQGLIPIKLLAFHDAVNVTIGLPFVRTSPDHGTAFDIAYKNCAFPDSMIAAINLAETLLDAP